MELITITQGNLKKDLPSARIMINPRQDILLIGIDEDCDNFEKCLLTFDVPNGATTAMIGCLSQQNKLFQHHLIKILEKENWDFKHFDDPVLILIDGIYRVTFPKPCQN